MKKLNKYLLTLTAAFALLATSCSNIASSNDSDDEKNSTVTQEVLTPQGNIAYVSVSLGEISSNTAASRTAYPDFSESVDNNYIGFSKFVLEGALKGQKKLMTLGTWETTTDGETTTTAYQKLTNEAKDASIPVQLYSIDTTDSEGFSVSTSENWEFTLTAYHHGSFDSDSGELNSSDTTYTTFAQTIEATVGSEGSNALNFNKLVRTSKYQYDTTKTGSIAITLNYVTPADTQIELFEYSSTGERGLGESKGDSYKKTLTIDGGTDSDAAIKSLEDGKYTYSVESIAEGHYVLKLTLTNHGQPVGTMTESIYVLQGLTSKSTLNVNVNGNYPITYKYVVLDEKDDGSTLDKINVVTSIDKTAETVAAEYKIDNENFFSSSVTDFPRYYSRLTESVTLPTSFNESITNKYLFCGWYEEGNGFNAEKAEFNNSKMPVLGFSKNTEVAEKVYVAKFINKNEAPLLTSVEITGTRKVGNTLTATAKIDESDFAGTIISWKWSASSTEGSYDEFTTGVSEPVAVTNSLATTSSYIVRPTHYEKTLKVRAIKKYTVAKYTEEGYTDLYKVVENTVNDTTFDNGDKAGSTPADDDSDKIGKGTLAVQNGFKLSYNYDSSEGSENIVIGSTLRDTGLKDSDSNVDMLTKDDAIKYIKDNIAAWTLDTLTGSDYGEVTYTLTFKKNNDASPTAPVISGYVDAVLSVNGYEDLELSENNGAFIKVRYADPNANDVLKALWSTEDNETKKDALQGFDYGYISFKNATFTHNYGSGNIETPLKYRSGAMTAEATPSLRKALGGAGGASVDSDVTVIGDANKSVAFYAAAKTENDDNTEITADEKGNLVGVVYAASNSVSVDFSDEKNASKYVGKRIRIEKLEITARKGKTGDYAASESYPVGWSLKATPVYNVSDVTPYDTITWTWTGKSEHAINETSGTSEYTILQEDWRSDTSENVITVSASLPNVWEENNPTVTNTTEPQTIVISKGIMALSSTTAINVVYKTDASSLTLGGTPAADSFEYVREGAVLDSVSSEIVTGYTVSYVEGATVEASTYSTENDTSSTPLTGKVKLVIKATGYEDYETDDFYVTKIPLQASLASNAVALSTDVGNISYGSLKFAINEGHYYEYEYSLNSGSTWIDVPQYEFVKTGDWSSVTSFVVRTRAKYVSGNTVAYRTGDSGSFYKVGDTEAVADATAATYTASSTINVTYSSSNDGTRGMPTSAFNITFTAVGNLDKLSAEKSGNTIKITAAVPTGYSIKYWTIDGETVAAFNSTNGSESIVKVEGNVMTIATDNLGEGTYPVKVVCSNTNGATYDAGVSVVVSK